MNDFRKVLKSVTNFTLGEGWVKSEVCHTQKKMPNVANCVSGHLESFKTNMFLGEKRGV